MVAMLHFLMPILHQLSDIAYAVYSMQNILKLLFPNLKKSLKGRKSKRKKSYAVDDEVKTSDKESDKDETPDHLSSSSKSSSGSGVSCGSIARRTSHSERGSRYEVLIRPIIEGKFSK